MPHVEPGDVAWVLISTALVLLMTIPGLALFYAGMVRKQNVLATMMPSFSLCALMTVVWMVAGYRSPSSMATPGSVAPRG
jgi:Amt family ammonium transporter